jgi:plastocyanin
MSIFGRRVSVRAVPAIAAVLTVAALLPVMTMSQAPSREITLVARGMAFYLESDPNTPNPTLHVAAGETVRVVLRNRDRGMTHDFAIPALDEALDAIDWDESGDVTFDVPEAPGTYEYWCRPHMLMMRGTIVVE